MNDPWGLATLLPWVIAALVGYYVLRVAVAVILLGFSRRRPGLVPLALRCAPAAARPLLRRVAACGLLGVALTSGTALAAEPTCPPAVDTIPVLDRVVTVCQAAVSTQTEAPQQNPAGPAPAAEPTAPEDQTRRGDYTVRAGDSLWQITAEHLGPSASVADIAQMWPRLWRANRSLIGDDPDRIMPGTVLALPEELVNGVSR